MICSVPCVSAQGSGNVLSYNGVNQCVNIGSQVSDNCRTIEMWFRPGSAITPALPDVETLIARDYLNGSGLNNNEFGLYFSPAPWNAANAGRLVFYRRIGGTGYWVYSDANSWQANVWYHVAGVIDPAGGMKMYINGVLQLSTDPSTASIQVQTGSATDDIMLATWGHWGAVNGQRFFNGDIDEVRFWTSPRTQNEVRDNMCRIVNPAQSGLQCYYRFDNSASSTLSDLTGNGYTGNLVAIANNAWHYSSAPIGDTATNIYPPAWNATTLLMQYAVGDEFGISNITGLSAGAHIYRVASLPNSVTGLTSPNGNYYGVFLTGVSGGYDIAYNYSSFSAFCQGGCAGISMRNDNAVMNWSALTAVSANCSITKTNESSAGESYREEYILSIMPAVSSNILGSDTSYCTGFPVVLSATVTNGSYQWNTGDTTGSITVNSGTYWVEVTNSGCSVFDTVTVTVGTSPQISLQGDTQLCPGQQLLLIANDPAASYQWSDGSSDSSLLVTQEGTYWVVATIGSCSAADTVTVNVADPVDLGEDISFCSAVSAVTLTAGQSSGNYVWSTGDTSTSVVVSQAGLYWAMSLDGCGLTDSISVTGDVGGGNVYVPNSFTPNNDGKNDVFFAVGVDVISFHMEIFDRWGELIFESYDISQGWDGRYKTRFAQEEVYVVRTTYMNDCDHTEVIRYSHVAVIR